MGNWYDRMAQNVKPANPADGLTGKDGSTREGAGVGFNLNQSAFNDRRNNYEVIRTAVLASARGLPSDLLPQLRGIIARADTAAVAAVDGASTLQTMHAYNNRLPAFQQPSVAQWEDYANTVLAGKTEMAANALANIEQDAARLVSAVLEQAAPNMPPNCGPEDVEAARADYRAILIAAGSGAKAKAAELVQQAIDAGDDLGIAALAGASATRFLRGVGADPDGVRLAYIRSLGKTYQPYSLESKYQPKGVQFIMAQDDASTSLAGMLAAARVCSDGGLADCRALILGGRI